MMPRFWSQGFQYSPLEATYKTNYDDVWDATVSTLIMDMKEPTSTMDSWRDITEHQKKSK
jgi:hypothetical protein